MSNPRWSGHLSREYQQFIEYEAEATRISVFHALFVPGLVQTPAYAAAISSAVTRADPLSDSVTARVEARMGRQQTFTARENDNRPAGLTIVLDESVLHRPVGGIEVMREQLDRLLVEARRPTVELVIMPLAEPDHPGLGGTFELLEFTNRRYPDLVFLESPSDDLLIRDTDRISRYQDTVRILRERGRGGETAIRAVETVRAAMS